MSSGQTLPAPKTWGFGLKALKRFPELLPLVGALTFACSMGTFALGYALYQKPDVAVNKREETPPWERVNPEQQQKLLTFNQKSQRIPELEQLRKEIGSYKF